MTKIKNTIPYEENKKAKLFKQIRTAHWKRSLCLGVISDTATINGIVEFLDYTCECEEDAKRIEEKYSKIKGYEKIIRNIFLILSEDGGEDVIEKIENKIKEIAKKCENELREKGKCSAMDDFKMTEKEEEELLKEVFKKFDEKISISANYFLDSEYEDEEEKITVIYNLDLDLKKIVENSFHFARDTYENYLNNERGEDEEE